MVIRKYLAVAAAYTFLLVAYFVDIRLPDQSMESPAASFDSSLEGLVSQTLENDRGAVGTLINKHVTLKNVYQSPPHRLNYVFIVSDITKFFTRPDWRVRTERKIISAACEDRRTRQILHRGGTFHYEYVDHQDNPLDTIEIDAHTCSLT